MFPIMIIKHIDFFSFHDISVCCDVIVYLGSITKHKLSRNNSLRTFYRLQKKIKIHTKISKAMIKTTQQMIKRPTIWQFEMMWYR